MVADLGIDTLVVYSFDESTGRLHEPTHTSTRSGAGPRFKTFHPSGQYVYVDNELDNTVAVYEYDAESGGLRELQIIKTLPPDAPESKIAESKSRQRETDCTSPIGDMTASASLRSGVTGC